MQGEELPSAGTEVVAILHDGNDTTGALGPFLTTKQLGRGDKAITLCAEPAQKLTKLVRVPEQGMDVGNMLQGITFPCGMRTPLWVASENPCSDQIALVFV